MKEHELTSNINEEDNKKKQIWFIFSASLHQMFVKYTDGRPVNEICCVLIGRTNNIWSTLPTTNKHPGISSYFCCWWPSEWRWRSVLWIIPLFAFETFFSSTKSMASPWILKIWSTYFSCSFFYLTMAILGNRRRSVSFSFTISCSTRCDRSQRFENTLQSARNRFIFLSLASFSLFIWGWLWNRRILQSM